MTTKQLAQYCADHFPVHTVHVGVETSHAVIAAVATAVIGFFIGYYLKGRGISGVKIDADNAINTVKSAEATVAAAV